MRQKSALGVVLTLCMFLVFGMPTVIYGQEIVYLKHIVQRGETIESLADMYDVNEDILKSINYELDTFYTGLEVRIPVDKKYMDFRTEEDAEAILKDLAGYFAGYKEATRIFKSGDYKRAEKMYASTIQRHGKYFPCEEAYFAMAMCDYNRKKWSAAIEGFNQVLNISGCSEELSDYSRRLKDEAENQREARRERTANILGGIFQAAAEVGTAYMAASQSETMGYGTPSMPQGLGSMSNAEFSAYVNNNMMQLANISVMQVQQQWAQEEMQFKNGYISNYRSMHGYAPSAAEVQSAYNSYLQSKGNAYSTVQKASSGLYDKELGIGNGSSTSSEPKTSSGYKCSVCRDTHVCQTCNGSGWQDAGLGDLHDHGGGIGKIPCGNCSNGRSKGNGVCSFCK